MRGATLFLLTFLFGVAASAQNLPRYAHHRLGDPEDMTTLTSAAEEGGAAAYAPTLEGASGASAAVMDGASQTPASARPVSIAFEGPAPAAVSGGGASVPPIVNAQEIPSDGTSAGPADDPSASAPSGDDGSGDDNGGSTDYAPAIIGGALAMACAVAGFIAGGPLGAIIGFLVGLFVGALLGGLF